MRKRGPKITVGMRGVDPGPGEEANNRFRRLTGLCGLSAREAGSYLGISEHTTQQKMSGKRGISEDEEAQLLQLYRFIRAAGVSLDRDEFPDGAIVRQIALREVAALLAREPVDEADYRMPAMGEGRARDIEAAEHEEAERQRKIGPLKLGRRKREGDL